MTNEQVQTIADSSLESQDEQTHRKTTDAPQTVTTRRKCKARLVNKLDEKISGVLLRHRRANDENKEDSGKWESIPAGGKSPKINIRYETGFGADGDYWFVSFTYKKTRWVSKGNFYCDLTKDDENGTVDAVIYRGRKHMEMGIKPSQSSDCTVRLYPFP